MTYALTMMVAYGFPIAAFILLALMFLEIRKIVKHCLERDRKINQSRGSIFEMGRNKTERQEVRAEERTATALERIADLLEDFLFPTAKFATLVISDSKGNILMPATLPVGKTATAVLHEFVSQGGAEVKPTGPVSYASSDPTIATVDPVSGLITAVAAGVATITGSDAGVTINGAPLSASDSVSDTPLAATVATLVITPN